MSHGQLDRLCVTGSVFFDAFVYFACEVRRLLLVILSDIKLSVAFSNIPGVVHYDSSRTLVLHSILLVYS